jgi:hypothetical protein
MYIKKKIKGFIFKIKRKGRKVENLTRFSIFFIKKKDKYFFKKKGKKSYRKE